MIHLLHNAAIENGGCSIAISLGGGRKRIFTALTNGMATTPGWRPQLDSFPLMPRCTRSQFRSEAGF